MFLFSRAVIKENNPQCGLWKSMNFYFTYILREIILSHFSLEYFTIGVDIVKSFT